MPSQCFKLAVPATGAKITAGAGGAVDGIACTTNGDVFQQAPGKIALTC